MPRKIEGLNLYLVYKLSQNASGIVLAHPECKIAPIRVRRMSHRRSSRLQATLLIGRMRLQSSKSGYAHRRNIELMTRDKAKIPTVKSMLQHDMELHVQ